MSAPKKLRDYGAGSFRVRNGVLCIRYSVRGRQIERATDIRASGDAELDRKRAARALRKEQKDAGKIVAGEVFRYEHMRKLFFDTLTANRAKALRFDRDGAPYLESVRRLDPFFEGFKVADIDFQAISEFRAAEIARGMSPTSVNRSCAALRRMLNLSLRAERIASSPHVPMFSEADNRRTGTIAPEDFARLVPALPAYLRGPVILAHATGMRRGEILGLKWANVNWLDRLIRLEQTKNGEAREIPFSDDLEKLLREQYGGRQAGCEFVFYRVDRRGHARQIGDFRKVWTRVCSSLGLGTWVLVFDAAGKPVYEPARYPKSKPRQKTEWSGLIFHDFRRDFVTTAERAGTPRHVTMALSGHRTQSTFQRYAISNAAQAREALANIQNFRDARKIKGQTRDNSENGQSENLVSN